MKKIKFIKRQDSGFKLSYGNSGETSLNLSYEIFDFISQGSLNPGEEKTVTFRVYKEDCIKAMSFVILKLPLYKTSSNYSNKVDSYLDTFAELYSKIDTYFGSNKEAEYNVSLFYRPDGRIYLKGLRVNGFSVRDYLVENYSALQFDDEGESGGFNLRILSDVEDNGEYDDSEETLFDNNIVIPRQQIFYGAPGTGKSHRIKEDESVKRADEKNLVFRTTFHPDSDYSTFVGAYKPTIRPVADKYKAVAGKDEEITYSFVPQAFLQAYVAAWDNQEENVYLIIEEINRGNCAQIFGDLFQLLDRDCDGYSEYPIMADRDLAKFLNWKDENDQEILGNKDGIKDGKLCLPKNLYIWATMNTSDQSLFPIDSAFKRRWEWVYVPIDTKKETWYIKVGENHYSWTSFLDKVNDELLTDETAEDKHLGFYFCKATEKREGTENEPNVITAQTFVGKVLFYLWNDVFKVYGIPAKIGSSKNWPYRKFYQTNGEVDETRVTALMEQLQIEANASEQQTIETPPLTPPLDGRGVAAHDFEND